MSVTPVAGPNTQITTGGTPVIAISANANGGYITNPALNTDQGITTAEAILVDPVNPPSLSANGTTVSIQPGGTYLVIPGSVNPVYVNAATGGHKFTAVQY